MMQHKVTKILNNNTLVLGIWRGAAEWVASDWFPRMRKAGLTHFAWVYSSSRLSQISTEDTLALIDGESYGVKVFNSVAEAQPWLAAGIASAQDTSRARPRVLVIEDNRDFSHLFSEMLKVMGCDTDVAFNAQAGLDAIKQFVPDVIFCDLSLPGEMDGIGFAKTVRASAHLAAVPLVAVSGRTGEEEQQQALKAGFDRVFAKPVKFVQVSRALKDVAEGKFFSN